MKQVDKYPTIQAKVHKNVQHGSAEWLELRKKYTSGTDSPVLMEKSSFKSPFTLWHEKSGLLEDGFKDNNRMLWGRRLESAIRDGVAEDMGYNLLEDVWVSNNTYYTLEESKLGATPDAVLAYPSKFVNDKLGKEQEGHGVFEIKNVDGLIHKQQWTENEPPVQYIIQLQHYMYVLGYSWGVLTALVNGNTTYTYCYELHQPTVNLIRNNSFLFWDYLNSGRQCPYKADSTTSTTNTLKSLYPNQNGKTVDKTQDNKFTTLVSNFVNAKRNHKDATKNLAECKNLLQAEIADNSLIECNVFDNGINKKHLIKQNTTEVSEYTVKARTQTSFTVKEII